MELGTINKIIYILWATIRPQMMKATHDNWVSNMTTDTAIVFKVAVATDEQKREIDGFGFADTEVIVVNERRGYNYAITRLTREIVAKDEDIMLLLSDDFQSPKGWDTYILSKFKDWDGAIYLNDGYQDPRLKYDSRNSMTLACMTYKCLCKINKTVFNPVYNHYFSDTEAFRNLYESGLLKDDRDIDAGIVFDHHSYFTGKRSKDESDEVNMTFWVEDQATFGIREKLPLEARLEAHNGTI
jgi:hypothetical protein